MTRRPHPTVALKNGRWLIVDLQASHQVVGWPVVGPALGQGRRITWLQVKDRDLAPDVEPADYYGAMARQDGIATDFGLITAADISRHALAEQDGAWALCTAGLSNGESVRARGGACHPCLKTPAVGTVNLLAISPRPLSLAASLEALSIVAEARTDAILSCALSTPEGNPVSGTGTDCIILAAPRAGPADCEERHCGLHTAWGRALATASFLASQKACQDWANRWV